MTLKEQVNKVLRDYIPAYPGHDAIADQVVQIFMDYLVEKIPEQIVKVIKALEEK